MKQFLSLVHKEFLHILRDMRTMLIVIGIPVVQIVLFGFAISTEVKGVRVAVLDPSKDVSSLRIAQRIDASEYFGVTRHIGSYSEVDSLFRRGETDLIIAFENHFEDNMLRPGGAKVQLITDGTDPNYATMLTGYASNILSDYGRELSGQAGVPYQITPNIQLLYNPQMKSAYNFVPGVIGMILLIICAMMTSVSIVREKEIGTMEVLLVSPVKPIYIILAKVVPYLAISCVNLATILLLSVFVLGVPVAGNLGLLTVLFVVYILVALSLGLLISTVTSTQLAAMLASGMTMIMPVILLSGMIYPVESMPAILEGISTIIPARWFISGVKKVMIEGLDIRFILWEMGILASMALLLTVLSLKKFKDRL